MDGNGSAAKQSMDRLMQRWLMRGLKKWQRPERKNLEHVKRPGERLNSQRSNDLLSETSLGHWS